MKKLFSVLAVAAIVTSAFAFSSKPFGGKYCASQTQNFQCAVITNVTELGTGGTTYYKYSAWDGTNSDCQLTRCATQTSFLTE
ncbi:MAG: hypothetical protein P0Y53_24110 [Candidatus Pseudobacter hemicellulosilyticus]|uniref:Uncharacterized protein n=1 Tax=Candidatus Pseudobacter hemicellulosilyticus TaxID=3121375 RepID=A0AAJ5WRD5_9BACT|nr:MAG: hypothetical protein P0Y53_24110 [Pseudobacter sp.]